MNQDELSKAIINIIKKETGALKDLLPSDLLENLEKITDFVEKKFNIKLNYIVVSSIVAAIAIILLLLNY